MISHPNPFTTGTTLHTAAALHAHDEHKRLDAAATLAESESQAPELRVLVTAREHLHMDLAYLSQFNAAEHVIQRVHGDARSFGIELGQAVAADVSYSQRIVDGRLPNLVSDVRHDKRIDGTTPALGSYACVPITLSDGRLYGTLGCLGRNPAPWLRERDVAFLRVLGRMLADELERDETEREAQRHHNEAIALGALFAALDARDSYTGRHSEAVVALSIAVTRELGMPESFVAEVEQVALLHDIGKIGIPDSILGKQGPLDDAEWELMHHHPAIGASIVASIDTLAQHAPAIRAEHERCDGTGYPEGLAREQIPLASRITFACDAYDAMMSPRPYRQTPMSAACARAEMLDKAGTQFDPDVVAALLRVVER
jgi:hypothetical protein